MIQSSVEFFRNLPPKQCCDCGNVIGEQHESYLNHCDQCIHDEK